MSSLRSKCNLFSIWIRFSAKTRTNIDKINDTFVMSLKSAFLATGTGKIAGKRMLTALENCFYNINQEIRLLKEGLNDL